MAEKQRIVTVSTNGIEAASEPQFIVEHEGRFFVTIAVLEFDPKRADEKPAYKKGLERVQGVYKAGAKVNAVRVIDAASFIDFTGVQTFKPGRGRGRGGK